MKDKLIKILETALNNNEMLLNGSIISHNTNAIEESITDVKYKNRLITNTNLYNVILFESHKYYKIRRDVKKIEFTPYNTKCVDASTISFSSGSIKIKPIDKVITEDTTIEGVKKGLFELILQSIFGDLVLFRKLKKSKVILNAKKYKYDLSYVITFNEFSYPIDDETVERLHNLYEANLKEARENKPMMELNKIMKKLGIDEA